MADLRFKIAPVWKGEWSNETVYEILDEVEDPNGTGNYRSLINDNDQPLTNTSAWECIIDLTRMNNATTEAEQLNQSIRGDELERVDHEATRVANENTRIENENTRQSRESTRVQKENARQDAESNRQSAEVERGTNEDNRKGAETGRVNAENARIQSENTRGNNETTRQSNETSRVSNENTRVSHENTRSSNESTRVNNEQTRQANEQTRQQQEGSPAEPPSASGSRWARYKQAESERNTNFGNNEGSASDPASATGSRWARFKKGESDRQSTFEGSENSRATTFNNNEGQASDTPAADGSRWARFKKAEQDRDALVAEKVADITRLQQEKADISEIENGNIVAGKAVTLDGWVDQKAIATPDTYSDAVRTTGGDIPVETSAGSKLETIKPVAGNKWTAKMLFNGSYNMLNAAKWGAANSQPFVGGIGSNFVYFLVPKLTLGTFGTADENNGLLFTTDEGENEQPSSVYYKPLSTTVPQSLTDGTSITPTSVSYDGKTYKVYETSDAGWLIIPKTYYDNDICAHISWEDWYDKHVSLDEPVTNPEAVVGTLILEGLLALVHSDKYLRGVTDEVCDYIEFGETSATAYHMVDELSVPAASWTNAATGESDSQGNALYRHSATVSGIKNGGAACLEGGTPLSVSGTTVSYIDTNATAAASVVFYQIPTTQEVVTAYTDSIFTGSNINTETGILPINDCSIEAQVGIGGEANITVKYAKNIVDQVAINATVDVPQIKEQVEDHEGRIEKLEDTAVRTGSYDASVAVGLADNFKGDTIVEAEFYKRKTGGTQSVGSGIAAIKEMRGKSIVWNQLVKNGNFADTSAWNSHNLSVADNVGTKTFSSGVDTQLFQNLTKINGHKYFIAFSFKASNVAGIVSFRNIWYGSKTLITSLTKPSENDTWKDYSFVITGNETVTNAEWNIFAVLGENKQVGDTFSYKNIFCVDLTLMFGEGNEPTTVEEFEKMFPLDYYDYNEGEVIPFAGENLVTTGFNQWDEQWEVGTINSTTGANKSSIQNIRSKNYIPIFPSTNYYMQGKVSAAVFFYDATKNYISFAAVPSDNIIATPAGAYFMRFVQGGSYGTTYNNDICINISDEDRNGTYEPYEKHTLPLDPSQWRDKQGNLVFPYGGMHGVDTAYDYAKVDADGYIRKAVRVFSIVDMGTLGWTYESNTRFKANLSLVKNVSNWNMASLICRKYVVGMVYYDGTGANNTIGIYDNTIYVKDTAYADASAFKTAMQGVMLIYELAEPVEVELATPVYAKYLVDNDGTEEITPANGATPYTTMANLSILYAMDARGEIKNLPKNYLSKESTENMLNAMVSAGIIGSYTMTYDVSSGRYAFVITAPVEPEPTPEESNN